MHNGKETQHQHYRQKTEQIKLSWIQEKKNARALAHEHIAKEKFYKMNFIYIRQFSALLALFTVVWFLSLISFSCFLFRCAAVYFACVLFQYIIIILSFSSSICIHFRYFLANKDRQQIRTFKLRFFLHVVSFFFSLFRYQSNECVSFFQNTKKKHRHKFSVWFEYVS